MNTLNKLVKSIPAACRRLVAAAACLALGAQPALAAVPATVVYQGTLRQGGGLSNGPVPFVFTIWDAPVGGTAQWTSGAVSVTVASGLFRYLLGVDNPAQFQLIPWATITPYLEVTVNGTVLSPREQLGSVPYAIYAGSLPFVSPGAAGVTVSNNLFLPAGRRLGIGTSAPGFPIEVVGTVRATAFQGDGSGLTSVVGLDPTRVLKAGDTMTGPLTMAANQSVTLSGAAGNITTKSSVTASAFFGDGSQLSGVSAANVAAANVTAGTFGPGVLLPPANVAAGNLPATVFATKLANGTIDNAALLNATLSIPDANLAAIATAGKVLDSALPGTLSAKTFSGLVTANAGVTLGLNQSLNLSGAGGNVTTRSSVTASAFFGDGSNLTGVTVAGLAASQIYPGTFGPGVILPAAQVGAGTLPLNVLASNLANGSVNSASQLAVTLIIPDSNLATITTAGKVADSALPTSMAGKTFTSATTVNADLTITGNTNHPLGIWNVAGNVGMGTTNPGAGARLDVTPQINISGAAQQTSLNILGANNDIGVSMTNSAGGGRSWQLLSSAGGSGIGAGNFAVYDNTAGLSRLSISPLGNVGLGTFNPGEKLEVGGTNTGIFLNGATSNVLRYNTAGVAPPAFTTRSAGAKLILFPQLNATNVDYGFGIEGGTLWYSVPQNTSGFVHKFYGGTTELMRVRGDGNVGIGTPNPGTLLDVAGTVRSTTGLFLSGSTAGQPGGTGLHMPYAGSSPNGGPAVRWTDGTLGNTFGLFVNSGVVFQGNAGNPAFRLSIPTLTGALGTEVIHLGAASTSDNSWFNAGNVGIGATGPGSKLTVTGGGNATVDILVNGRIQTGDGNNNGGIWVDNAGNRFVGSQGNATAMGLYNQGWWVTVLNSGFVGIGTQIPTASLHIGGPVGPTNGIRFPDGSFMQTASIGSANGISTNGDTNITADANNVGVGAIIFNTGPNERARIQNNGQFRINNGLNVDQNNANNGTVNPGITFGGVGSGEGISSKRTGGGNANGLDFYTSFASRMHIDNNPGNVFIGNGAIAGGPMAGLNVSVGAGNYVATSDGTRTAFLGADGSGYGMVGTLTNHDFVIRANNTERVRVQAAGNVGIGVNPGSKLEVGGDVRIDDNRLYLRGGADTNHGMVYDGGPDGPQIFGFSGIDFHTKNGGDVNRMRIASDGTVTIDANGGNGGGIDLRLGATNSGEGIGSKRNAGGNLNGLDFYTNGANRMAITNGGNVMVNTTTPDGNGIMTINGRIVSNNTGVSGGIWVNGGTDTQFFGSNSATLMGLYNTTWGLLMDQGGNVGIGGAASAGAKLEVNGQTFLDNVVRFPGGTWMYGNGAGTRSWNIGGSDQYWEVGGGGDFHYRNSADVDVAVIGGAAGRTTYFNGNVGVGMAGGPQQNLSVQGNMNVNQANADGMQLSFGSGSGEGIGSKRSAGGNQNDLEFFTGGGLYNPKITVTNAGLVLIGNLGIMPSPQVLLTVAGRAGNNTGIWENLSDRRLKRDIVPIASASALATITKLQGVSFNWKDRAKDAELGRVRGFIAQDVEKVVPEWVRTNADGIKSLSTIGVDAMLVESIKELKAELDAQHAEIEALRGALRPKLEQSGK